MPVVQSIQPQPQQFQPPSPESQLPLPQITSTNATRAPLQPVNQVQQPTSSQTHSMQKSNMQRRIIPQMRIHPQGLFSLC
jgi:hypothetical protein